MGDMKRGDIAICHRLSRTLAGLRINIQCHPEVEAFMQQLAGDAEVEPVGLSGRYWVKPKGLEGDLNVYTLPQELHGPKYAGGLTYRLDRPGHPLLLGAGGDGAQVLNLSTIRLVGAGGLEGISFQAAGVHSDTAVDQLKTAYASASKAFYDQFMKPMNISVSVRVEDV